jgi:hypothetical protein
MRESPFNVIQVENDPKHPNYDQFCPQSINKNPNDPAYIDILSSCGGENRFMTYSTVNITDFLSVQSNILVEAPLGEEIDSICNIGGELLYAPKNQADAAKLYAQPTGSINSFTDMRPADAGYKSIDGMICVRDSESAIVYGKDMNGKDQLSVIFGQSSLDSRNRYHSTMNYDGKNIYSVIGALDMNRVVVTLSTANEKDDMEFTFFHFFLDGPTLLFNKDVTKLKPVPTQTFNLVQDGTVSSSQDFSITYMEYNSDVKFHRKDQGSTPPTSTGTYKIDSLGSLEGPIFNVKVNDSNSSLESNRMLNSPNGGGKVMPGKVTLVDPLTKTKDIPSPASVNSPMPQKIYQSEDHLYKVGLLVNSMSCIAVYYKEDTYIGVEDLGFYPVVHTAGFVGGKLGYFLWIAITQEGGFYNLRWVTKTLGSNGFTNRIVGNISRITSEFGWRKGSPYTLEFQEIGNGKVLIVTGKLRWIIDVNKNGDGNWEVQNPMMI